MRACAFCVQVDTVILHSRINKAFCILCVCACVCDCVCMCALGVGGGGGGGGQIFI